MAKLAIGSSLARIIGVCAVPILTRLYTPEDFGVVAVFVALVALLAPVLTLRYVVAIPLPRHDGVAMNLMALSLGLMLILGVFLTICLALFAQPLLELISMGDLASWWWLIILALIGTGTYEMLSLWATRRREYEEIARTQVTQSVAGAVVKIGFGLFGAGSIGLLVGQVVTQSAGIGTFVRRFLQEFKGNWSQVRLSRLMFAALKHRGFPTYRLPSQFFLVFSAQAPLFFVAVFYDKSTVGQFSLALTVLAIPVSVLSQTIARAFYAEIAPIAKQKMRMLHLSTSVAKRAALFGVIPAFFVIATSPFVFPLLFGEAWAAAGWMASILAICIVPQFVSQSLVQILSATERNHIYLLFNISRAALVIATLAIPPFLGFGIYVTVFTYSIVLSIQRVLQSISVLRILTVNVKK